MQRISFNPLKLTFKSSEVRKSINSLNLGSRQHILLRSDEEEDVGDEGDGISSWIEYISERFKEASPVAYMLFAIHIITFALLIYLYSEVSTLRASNVFLSQEYESALSKMSFTQMQSGLVSFDIQADQIRFPNPHTFHVSEVVNGKSRSWSPGALKVYVGDTVSWRWTTYENVVSSDSAGNEYKAGDARRELYSGAPVGPGVFSHTFERAGSYYWV